MCVPGYRKRNLRIVSDYHAHERVELRLLPVRDDQKPLREHCARRIDARRNMHHQDRALHRREPLQRSLQPRKLALRCVGMIVGAAAVDDRPIHSVERKHADAAYR
jgi:hypothetical protein